MTAQQKGSSPVSDRAGAAIRGARRRVSEIARRVSLRQAIGVAVVAVALLAFVLAITNFFYAQAAHSSLAAGKPYKVQISGAASGDMKPIVESYIKEKAGGHLVLSDDGRADVIISNAPVKGYEGTRVTGMPPVTLTAISLDKVLQPAREYWYCYKRTGIILKQKDAEVESLERYIRAYYGPENSMTLTGVGDIIPGRHVAEAMAKNGVAFSFKTAEPLVKDSDVTVGDLECPLTDRFKPPYDGMTF